MQYQWNFKVVFDSLPFLLEGLKYTVGITALAMAGALILGLIVSLARLSGRPWLNVPALVYTEFFRWLGRGDEIEPVVEAWKAGDRRRALELAPEGLVREIFLLGPVEAQRERLAAFAEAGIETAVLALLAPPDAQPDAIAAFAP